MNEPCTVLIVDDDEFVAGLLAEFLEMSGYDVDVVHSGTAALHADRLKHHDIAIVDIMLPDIDGYSLAGSLRQENTRCKVIALSGLPPDTERGEEVFDAWMEKPVELDALQQLLDAI